jgi:predicted  nucleic acid-binding Zn-ribbon protein
MIDINELKVLKEEYINLQKKQAGYETSLESLRSQRESLIKKCEELGVTPEELSQKITDAQAEYDKLILEIKDKLYPAQKVIMPCTPAPQPDMSNIFDEEEAAI